MKSERLKINLAGLLLMQVGAHAVFPQLSAPTPEPVVGARMPAVSPDGKELAFVYRGDVWIAPAKGGRATPLTSHIETDAFPLFSPDGKWIAFASRRNGNWDVFAIPADGGSARQLTFAPGAEDPVCCGPAAEEHLICTKRESPLRP